MNRKTLFALATFAGLGILAVIALTPPEKGERTSDRPRPVAKLDTADIETIEVTKDGATTVIKNDGGKYKVTAPVAYAADEAAAKAAFEGAGQVGRLRPRHRAEGQARRVRGRRQERHPPGRQGEGRQGAGRRHRRQVDRPGHDGPPDRQGRGLAGHRHLALHCSTRRPPTGATRASPRSPPATPSRSRSRPRTAARSIVKKTGAKAGTRGQVGRRRIVGEDRQARQRGPERHRRRRCRSGRPTTSPTASSWPTRAWSRRR